MSLLKLVTALKGGTGSGNFGHAGRPGKVGGSGGSMLAYHYTSAKNAKLIKKHGFKASDDVFGKAVYLAPTKDAIVSGNPETQLKVKLSNLKLNDDYNSPDAYEKLRTLQKSIWPTNLADHFMAQGFDGLDLSNFTHEPQLVLYNTTKIESVE